MEIATFVAISVLMIQETNNGSEMTNPSPRIKKPLGTNRTLLRTSYVLWVLCLAILHSCKSPAPPADTLFTLLPSSETGINFVNRNDDTDTLSIIDYLYYYNGGGVSVGDINNDGLPDVYFTANTGGNRLYLNKGGLKFEDITASAGVQGKADWTTGVTMADVNGDGYLDIYVSTVAKHDPHLKNIPPHVYFNHSVNQLFINNKNNSFTESAAEWGLDVQGYNTQAVFFDYDKDGDLDVFLLQHSTHQPDAYGPATLRDKYSEVSAGVSGEALMQLVCYCSFNSRNSTAGVCAND